MLDNDPALDGNNDAGDERIRIQKIIQSPEGVAHPTSAKTFAFESSMGADEAIRLMSKLPKETTSTFLDGMNVEGPIGIRPGGSARVGHGEDPKTARLAEIREGVRQFNMSRGYHRPDAT